MGEPGPMRVSSVAGAQFCLVNYKTPVVRYRLFSKYWLWPRCWIDAVVHFLSYLLVLACRESGQAGAIHGPLRLRRAV